VEDVLGFCAPELATHHIDAVIDEQAPGATIYADARQLTQACLNLILNAIDAMPEGGRLTLTISHGQADNERPTTLISVSDTGQGIDPEVSARIFNPFVTTKASGTGLGLAKVFSIMENHDGRVECVSEQGVGATFNLYLPADEGEQA
jgi:two-component system, sporulation sensor kinase E